MFSRIIFVACVSAIDVYWLQAVQFENIKILPGSIRWSHLSAALSPPAPAGAFLAATLNTALYMASEGEMAHLSREGSDRQLESQEFRSSSLVQVATLGRMPGPSRPGVVALRNHAWVTVVQTEQPQAW